jgi:xanthine dehydrogenase accessory factor
MNFWETLAEASKKGESVALVTVVGVEGSAPRSTGARMVVWPDGRILGTIGGGNLEFRAIQAAVEAIPGGKPVRLDVHLTRDLGMCCGGATEVLIEPLLPVDRLVVFGAGHVAKPTVAMARIVGFDCVVVDEREELNTSERFPESTLHTGDPRRFAWNMAVDSRTWILIVTHDHQLDQDLLELLLEKPWAWLGLIGSKAKITKFYLRLRAAGHNPERFKRVSAPVGLDIGAVTPEEIAVSILAELVHHKRAPEKIPVAMSAAIKSFSP